MPSFSELGLSEALCQALKAQSVTQPSPIQQKAIPALLEGRELCAQSPTGTGKTLAFLLPILDRLDPTLSSAQAIILAPTHDLSAQIYHQALLLIKNGALPLRAALLIGGGSRQRQLEHLRQKPQLIIGTPGRVLEMIEQRKIKAHTVSFVVLDEGDRLLDDANQEAVQAVLKTTLASRRRVSLFSASLDDATLERAKQIQKNPLFLRPKSAVTPMNLTHIALRTQTRGKILTIRKLYAALHPRRSIVFCNNPNRIAVTVERLRYHHLTAVGLLGQSSKQERQTAPEAFREGRAAFLDCSDLGSRGLDFPQVDLVIHLDIPENPVFYQHRAGRAGRQGHAGMIVSLVTPYEAQFLKKYEKALGISISYRRLSHGALVEEKAENNIPLRQNNPAKTEQKKCKKTEKNHDER